MEMRIALLLLFVVSTAVAVPIQGDGTAKDLSAFDVVKSKQQVIVEASSKPAAIKVTGEIASQIAAATRTAAQPADTTATVPPTTAAAAATASTTTDPLVSDVPAAAVVASNSVEAVVTSVEASKPIEIAVVPVVAEKAPEAQVLSAAAQKPEQTLAPAAPATVAATENLAVPAEKPQEKQSLASAAATTETLPATSAEKPKEQAVAPESTTTTTTTATATASTETQPQQEQQQQQQQQQQQVQQQQQEQQQQSAGVTAKLGVSVDYMPRVSGRAVDKSIVVTGLIKDAGASVRGLLRDLSEVACLFSDAALVILESNSKDDTIQVLNEFSNRPQQKCQTEGRRSTIPFAQISIMSSPAIDPKLHRIHRLVHYRNELRERLTKYRAYDYTFMVDMDIGGIDVGTLQRHLPSYINSNMDAVCLNDNYRDVFAMVSKDQRNWCYNPAWRAFRKGPVKWWNVQKDVDAESARNGGSRSGVMQVNSCFNAATFYKTNSYLNSKCSYKRTEDAITEDPVYKYFTVYTEKNQMCEHVYLHDCLRKQIGFTIGLSLEASMVRVKTPMSDLGLKPKPLKKQVQAIGQQKKVVLANMMGLESTKVVEAMQQMDMVDDSPSLLSLLKWSQD